MKLLLTWNELPKKVKIYFIVMLTLGVIPVIGSFFYPLHQVNAKIDEVVTNKVQEITFDDYKKLSSLYSEKVPAVTASREPGSVPETDETASSPNLPTAAYSAPPKSNVDWIQLIGAINSIIMGWVIYFDKRRREDKEGKS